MTRPLRNQLLAALFVVAALFAAPRMSDGLMWVLTAVVTPMLVLAVWVTGPFRRARRAFAKKQYESAAAELTTFEKSLEVAWKRFFAGLAVGFYTTNAVAAARNTLGAVRLEQARLEDAEVQFKAALQLDPGYAVPWGNLAVLAALRGNAGGAEEARLKAAALGFKPQLLAAVIKNKLAK